MTPDCSVYLALGFILGFSVAFGGSLIITIVLMSCENPRSNANYCVCDSCKRRKCMCSFSDQSLSNEGTTEDEDVSTYSYEYEEQSSTIEDSQ